MPKGRIFLTEVRAGKTVGRYRMEGKDAAQAEERSEAAFRREHIVNGRADKKKTKEVG